jgi:SAM-dependent methyltransferase
MAAIAPFDPHRFETAAAHYKARAPYSPRVIARIAQLTELGPQDRLMDLGCGPGTLALAFAPLVGSVVAVDPEPAMLALAEAALAEFKSRVVLIQGSSNDLGPHFGTFKLVTIGRAFHWMDRADTAHRLDELVVPDGALALLRTKAVRTPETTWVAAYEEIIERNADGQAEWHGTEVELDESVLLASPFRRLERISTIERRTVDAAVLIDRALSMSRTSPGRIGADGVARLTADIQGLADCVATDGQFVEVVESTALIARRPGH